MSLNPNLILYTCIAKDTTILADFVSKHADLSDTANKCLEKTPAFHSVFSHTVNGKTYMFFIYDPFVYFGIFDESLERHACLLFLESVKNVFMCMMNNDTVNKCTLSSHCFQGEMSPLFHQLMGLNSELDSKDGLEEDKYGVSSDDDVSRPRRVRYVWKNEQVMVVLFMDFVVCAGLFVIWLCVCNGFRCVSN
ncbi:hypothetical protein QVD17_30956 [Tagetes erecta]|uniref:Longin domain-containing protein n=1 Tax=Tagetes erecta TaxID=13708 RepID=A0AAD8K3P6_TARER|nr:hypothetical protein QVD17_30956 [Tagetes erecta]